LTNYGFRKRDESGGVPAAWAYNHHRHERIRVSRLCVLLQRRVQPSAPGRMYAGTDTTRIWPEAATPTTEGEKRMTLTVSLLPVC
jgi:hypothetical protein